MRRSAPRPIAATRASFEPAVTDRSGASSRTMDQPGSGMCLASCARGLDAEEARRREAHDLGQVVVAQQAAGLDPTARLAIRAETVLEGHVGAPHQVPGADMAEHRLQRGPDLAIRVVEQVAEPDRKADLEVEPRVLEW